MTTIAYDGETLAVDSLVIADDLAFGFAEKLVALKRGRYVACAGRMDLIPVVAAWLNSGDKSFADELMDGDVFNGLLVKKDGSAFEISNAFRLFPACIPWAGGSGTTVALTAMRCGKTAVEAVEIACELDTNSRGPVQSVRIGGKKR